MVLHLNIEYTYISFALSILGICPKSSRCGVDQIVAALSIAQSAFGSYHHRWEGKLIFWSNSLWYFASISIAHDGRMLTSLGSLRNFSAV